MPIAGQLSIFGAESNPVAPGDVEGLLAGPGEVARMDDTARILVTVAELWRARTLVAELRLRGLEATCVTISEDQISVRTAFTPDLAEVARAWLPGGVKHPPRGFYLDGRRLRLWFVAAGRLEPIGVVLRLGGHDEPCWPGVGAALAGAGVPAALVGPRAGGPAYRIVGRRRLARLAELLGDRPEPAPVDAWPVV